MVFFVVTLESDQRAALTPFLWGRTRSSALTGPNLSLFSIFAHFFASPLLFSDDTERALVAVSFFVVTLESDERAALTQVFCGGGAREPQIAAIRI